MGLPTQHAGSWMRKDGKELLKCGKEQCLQIPAQWRRMAKQGCTWEEMLELERIHCHVCYSERQRRNRLVETDDVRLKEEPFLSAPYVNRNNDPKYHAMFVRAVEIAKRSPSGPQYILWVCAQDSIHNPKEVGSTPELVDQKKTDSSNFTTRKLQEFLGYPLFLSE